jgi:hypothetical protein
VKHIKPIGLPVLCSALLLSHAALADELLLRNGDKITGTLLSLSPTLCTFTTDWQKTLQIKPGDIAQLSTTQPVAIDLHTGDRLVGIAFLEENGSLHVQSKRFGSRVLEMHEVAGVSSDLTAPLPPVSDATLLASRARGTGDAPPAPAQGESAQQQQPPAAKPTIGEEQEKQLAEEEERSLLFLRETTVLLKPGQTELEFDLSYLRNDETLDFRFLNFPLSREVRLGTNLRAGLLNGLEGFVNLPIAWGERKVLRSHQAGFVNELFFETNDDFGIGDVNAGLKYSFVREDAQWPEVVGYLSAIAPTGSKPDPLNPAKAALGDGRWQTTVGATLVRSYDPAVLFGGISYTYRFDATLNGVDVSGAQRFGYNFGVGFAVNNQLTLSGQFLGAYETQVKLDGRKIDGSELEPMSLLASLTYRISKDQFIEPSVIWGLNNDATDTILTIAYGRQF